MTEPELASTPTEADCQRDLAADMALCDAATPGPWLAWASQTGAAGDWYAKAQVAGLPRPSVDRSEVFRAQDAAMIAASRDGWPAAIRRALWAEKRVRELEAENAALRKQVEGHCERIAKQSDALSRVAQQAASQEGPQS